MGYRWHIGTEERVIFSEDHWFYTCNLAIPFWEIYTTINEQGISVKDAWDDTP
jgi:hypothetical protein